jgi:glycosyltransferase involved in cell wall biosynthesis
VPALAVVIPTYNCAPFLAESLDSILGQVDADTEVIVVDDGSEDDTRAVLSRYTGRITVVAGGHGGLSAARNLGLAHATADWIAFHDADDVACPDRVAFARAYLREHPGVEAVFGNGERLDRPGERVVPPGLAARCAGRPLTAEDLFLGFPIYFQGALVPRRAFVDAGAFDLSLRVQPDIEYGYRLVGRLRAVFVDRVLFRYRWHPGGNSRDRLGGREDIARILEGLLAEDGEAVRAIGRRRLRARIGRHHYRIARAWRARGDAERARHAARRAVEAAPLNLRYQLLYRLR